MSSKIWRIVQGDNFSLTDGLPWDVGYPTLGSLSNDHGNAKDDGWKKMDLNLTFEFCKYLELFCKPSGLKPYSN